MRYAAALRRLVADLAERQIVRDQRVLHALGKVPRHLFVDEALWLRAYSDDALPIGYGQTISKPSTVARMTEALATHPRDRVLEIGTGSGYQTAVLAGLVSRVYSVERLPALAVRARAVLNQLGAFHAQVRAGDGALGWPEAAPFQGILVTAAADQVPQLLLEQMDVGGHLVAPLEDADGQRLRCFVRASRGVWREEVLEACRFVPLVAGEIL